MIHRMRPHSEGTGLLADCRPITPVLRLSRSRAGDAHLDWCVGHWTGYQIAGGVGRSRWKLAGILSLDWQPPVLTGMEAGLSQIDLTGEWCDGGRRDEGTGMMTVIYCVRCHGTGDIRRGSAPGVWLQILISDSVTGFGSQGRRLLICRARRPRRVRRANNPHYLCTASRIALATLILPCLSTTHQSSYPSSPLLIKPSLILPPNEGLRSTQRQVSRRASSSLQPSPFPFLSPH